MQQKYNFKRHFCQSAMVYDLNHVAFDSRFEGIKLNFNEIYSFTAQRNLCTKSIGQLLKERVQSNKTETK